MGAREVKMYIMGLFSILLFGMEISVGFITGSMALVADSFHMLSDLAALIVGMIAIRLAAKEGDIPGYTYGYQRAEILGAFTNGIILLSLTFSIFLDGIQRFFDPVHINNPIVVLIVAGIGFSFNMIGIFMFMGGGDGGHGHSHGGGHGHGKKKKSGHGHDEESGHHSDDSDDSHDSHKSHDKKKKKKKGHGHGGHGHSHGGADMNIRGIILHAAGDAVGNIGVIASTLFIMLTPFDWRFYMDPVASFIIAIIIIHSALPLVKSSTALLMQGVPDEVDMDDLRKDLLKIKDVVDVKELHVWALSEEKNVASIHLIVRHSRDRKTAVGDDGRPVLSVLDLQRYTRIVEDLLEDEFDINDATIQVSIEEEGDAMRRLAKMSSEDVKNIVLPFLFSVLQPVDKRQSLRTFHKMVGAMYPEEWDRVRLWVKDSLPEEEYEHLLDRMPQLAINFD